MNRKEENDNRADFGNLEKILNDSDWEGEVNTKSDGIIESKSGRPIELNLNIADAKNGDGATVRDILTVFSRGSVKIFTAVLVSLILGVIAVLVYHFAIYSNYPYAGSVTGVISFNYAGAEEGLDPHGRRLDVSKIVSPNILDRALAELNMFEYGLTSDDIRQNVRIEGIIPIDAMQRILIIKEIATRDPSRLDELNQLSYISTQFAVTLNVPSEFSFLAGTRGVELLEAIFSSYQRYFFEEYGGISVLSTAVESLPLEEYDYFDAHRVLNSQLNNMLAYLSAKSSEAPDFRSIGTQMSFGDIILNLDLLKIDLSLIRSLIEVRLVTKDKDLLMSTYTSLITDMNMNKNIQLERARINQNAAQSYQKDSVVIYGGGSGDSMQLSQSSDTYDMFIRASAVAAVEAIRLEDDIEY
ncbi:MAG: hypothetical protein FWH10_06275, partial [Oscillospiraceae bacterium]|nr:hypothetical protein [Oscillospiraceae bacterium]